MHTSHCPACIACGETDSVTAIGPMCPVGGYLTLRDYGTLYECHNCNLLFRHPYLTEEELIAQYAELPATNWTAEPGKRPDFDLTVAFILRNLPRGRVLDIGCFRGDLLAMLPDAYEKWGIEPAEEASRIASSRGIHIAGHSLDEALSTPLKTDVVVAIDLIEHLLAPMHLFAFAKQVLNPGGYLIVATGNPNYWLWRRHRLNYWYNWTEHVAFLRQSWFQWAGKQAGLKIVHTNHFCHYAFSQLQVLKQATRTAAYEVAEILYRKGRVGNALRSIYPLSRMRLDEMPPRAWWTRDHHLIVLQKPE